MRNIFAKDIPEKETQKMFKIGEHVVHGTNGVCEVRDICNSPFNKEDTRKYYILKPVYGPESSTIYSPVDNKSVIIRELMSKEEILKLIKMMPSIPPAEVETEKHRKDVYKAAMSTADPAEYVRIIKAVHIRRENFEKAKKHLPNTDLDFEALAKRRIFEEFASVLGIGFDEVNTYINNRLKIKIL
ncbi:MAG: hypothetical protein E7623_05635 [Ruminococcaceae bacterium]|nr:hypothetical protein [Oscillospiraceae bacterium]